MKPGNLFFKVPNPAATKDEDSIKLQRASNLRCAVFLCPDEFETQKRKENKHGKKTLYL